MSLTHLFLFFFVMSSLSESDRQHIISLLRQGRASETSPNNAE
jgi:hypothetical protein